MDAAKATASCPASAKVSRMAAATREATTRSYIRTVSSDSPGCPSGVFAAFGITYRYAMWLRRPPTRMYWRRGWSVFLTPRYIGSNAVEGLRRFTLAFAANRFIFRRGRMRRLAHWLIMWGCVIAAAITFPLVWGWIHFETVPDRLDLYRAYVFGVPILTFLIESLFGFLVFHGLVWSALLVISGVMIAFRHRMVARAAVTLQLFAQDVMPLVRWRSASGP